MPLFYGKWVKSLSSFIALTTILTACARPPSTTVGEGADPFQVDKDVVFRTTYYFRTFDYCVARELKNGKFKNVVVPLTDSLYRFRMTGKSNSLLSDVKFESGTLRAWEIDPFGARVEYDPELRRHRVISPREADADARRAPIKRDLNEMLEMYDRIAERNADPNDQGALAAANRTKRQENDNAVLGKLSTALQGKIDELASVASGPDEADFTMGPTSPPPYNGAKGGDPQNRGRSSHYRDVAESVIGRRRHDHGQLRRPGSHVANRRPDPPGLRGTRGARSF